MLATFVLQTVVTRSHFHFGAAQAAVEKVDAAGGFAGKPTKAPAGHDESNCPLWHAGGICGTAVAAVANLQLIGMSAQARAPIDQRVIFVERFVAHWRSRAPPASLT